MVIEKRVVVPRTNISAKRNKKPTIIKWKGVPMLRSQSINAAINDIYQTSRSMDFLKINLIGASGSGKTTLSYVLSHSLHVLDPTFSVHHMEDKDLINFEGTIKMLPRGNIMVVFDDLSGLVSKFGKTALDKLIADLTTVRHMGDVGRKIIIILNFHSQKQLAKVLRISNFTFYTECQNEEVGYFEELLGKGQKQKIQQFVKLRAASRMYHRFSFTLSKGDQFTYKDGDPFRLVLYNNGITTRFVVSPRLEFITEGKKCPVCFPVEQSEDTKRNLEQFTNDILKKFPKSVAKKAVELKLLQRGIATQTKNVMLAQKYIELALTNNEINLDELAKEFNLEPRKTKLFPGKQPPERFVNPLVENDTT